jgi:hypothetical protein
MSAVANVHKCKQCGGDATRIETLLASLGERGQFQCLVCREITTQDLRSGPRIAANTPAWVEAGKNLIPCTLANVGHGGAQLRVSTDIALPRLFSVRLTRDGRIKRSCQIIWQSKDRLGVRFVRVDGTAHSLTSAEQVPGGG